MKFLFVHQNFPGQFRHMAHALADDPRHQVFCLGQDNQVRSNGFAHPRARLLTYPKPPSYGRQTHHYLREHEWHVRRGQAVVRALTQAREQLQGPPDVVVAHPGWGEALFLRDLFPRARHIHYFEYFYRAQGGDLGFDPEFPATMDDQLRVRIKNNTQLQALVACDTGLSPTRWQRGLFPAEFQSKLHGLHDGIDTTRVGPDPGASLTLADGTRLAAGDKVVSYVARNLEPYRGFHVFMRSLARLQQLQPHAHVLVVGGDEVSYGRPPPRGHTYRSLYTAEMQDSVDWRRVHFLAKLPYEHYLRVLQVSAAHVYLTYPFVLSWSLLEAMAAQCLVIASRTAPVEEVIDHGENGLLVDFFDHRALADTVSQALNAQAELHPLRQNARARVVDRFDLRRVCLPQALQLVTGA